MHYPAVNLPNQTHDSEALQDTGRKFSSWSRLRRNNPLSDVSLSKSEVLLA